MNSHISADLIYKAMCFYKEQYGFKFLDAPLLVDEDIINLTIPFERKAKEHNGLFYVGSAEQSFYQLMKNGEELDGDFLLITPCQRNEQYLDDQHLEIFLKIELISTKSSLLNTACDFFCCHTDKALYLVEDKVSGETDIYINGIEVGSYGSREYMGKTIYYGTGLALPRFIQATL